MLSLVTSTIISCGDPCPCVGTSMYAEDTRVFRCKQGECYDWISCMRQIKMSSPPAHFHSHLPADLF